MGLKKKQDILNAAFFFYNSERKIPADLVTLT